MLRKRNATNKITQGQNPLCWSEKEDSQCLYWGGWNLALHWTPAGLAEKRWQFKEVLWNSSFMFSSPQQIHSCGSVSSAQKLGNTPQSTQIFVGPHIRLTFTVLCLRPFPEQHNQPSDSTWSSSTSAVIITSPLHYLQLFCFIPEFKNLK